MRSSITPDQLVAGAQSLQPGYLAVLNDTEPGELASVSVYPPKEYVTDYGLDFFFDGKFIRMWCDGVPLKNFGPKTTMSDLLGELVRELETAEAYATS